MHRVRKQIGFEDSFDSYAKHTCNMAILDTGVAPHPDLNHQILDFHDFVHGKCGLYDEKGHGTHVCGIACGTGEVSKGWYRGIAPKTKILVGKVLDEKGNGSVYHMLKGIDWVMKNKKKHQIRILNISVGLGKDIDEEKENILLEKLMEAVEMDIIVVCSAGNNGPGLNSISKIASCKSFLTVGCHDGDYFKNKKNACESYSGRGGIDDIYIKPDLVAPGTNIVSCNAGIKKKTKGYQNAYINKSGTSMATPIVAGVLAFVLQCKPQLDNPTLIRTLLLNTDDLKEPLYKQGYGMINVKKVLTCLV